MKRKIHLSCQHLNALEGWYPVNGSSENVTFFKKKPRQGVYPSGASGAFGKLLTCQELWAFSN
jgi:hypothetical protein